MNIPQYFWAGASPSDGLISYLEHSLQGNLTPRQKCSRCIRQSQPTGREQFSVYINEEKKSEKIFCYSHLLNDHRKYSSERELS